MTLPRQSFKQFTWSEDLPAPPLLQSVLSCKVLRLFWSWGCQFHTHFYTSKPSYLPHRAPLSLKGLSSTFWRGLAGKTKTYNQLLLGRAKDESWMCPRCKMDLDLRILKGILWAWFRLTSNIAVYLFQINTCVYIDMGCVSVSLWHYVLLMNQSSQALDRWSRCLFTLKRTDILKGTLFHWGWTLLTSKMQNWTAGCSL